MIVFTSIIPFRILYFFSDILAFKLQYFIGYRKKTIAVNLTQSFPNTQQTDILYVTKRFYHHLSDVFFETLKSYSIRSGKKTGRFVITNPEILDKLYLEQKSCVLMMAHYANWEWIIQSTHYLKHRWCSIYKPLRNKKVNSHLLNVRKKFGMHLFPQDKTGFMVRNNINAPSVFTYISDQSPAGIPEQPYWIPFLNRLTACHSGAEVLAVKFNLPVYYLDVQKISRGKYKAEIKPVCMNPKDTEPGQITTKYMQMLEAIIKEKPEYWLWSHRRWKKTVPKEFIESQIQ